jgi:branched-chain amino acid transport system permease protein
VFLHRAFDAPPLLIAVLVAPIVSGLIGLGVGYFTLRLKGVYFAIATLAVAIILETIVVNWEYVGGAGGYYLLIPEDVVFFDSYIEWLFVLILAITLIAIIVSRYLNSSKIGQGLAAIRDDELAAECMGVPTLKLKLISTTVMGGLMGAAGAPFPYFITFVEPASAFNLLVAVMAIAVPMIGGTASWIGPVIGGLLLGTIQETVTVNISSELNLLIVGVVLVGFISLAPQGITGLYQDFIHFIRKRRKGNG